jgi:hypothetical protein
LSAALSESVSNEIGDWGLMIGDEELTINYKKPTGCGSLLDLGYNARAILGEFICPYY